MPTPAAGRPCVLVVDDVAQTRALVGAFIHRRGYQSLEASDGREALMLLRTNLHRVCAIVLDLQMQGMNGFQFREVQRADPAFESIPVIVLTTTGRADILKYTLDVEHVIFKPFIADALEAALSELCPLS